jgi:hypothetical protein
MAPVRLSRLQKRSLFWLAGDEQRSRGMISSVTLGVTSCVITPSPFALASPADLPVWRVRPGARQRRVRGSHGRQ